MRFAYTCEDVPHARPCYVIRVYTLPCTQHTCDEFSQLPPGGVTVLPGD